MKCLYKAYSTAHNKNCSLTFQVNILWCAPQPFKSLLPHRTSHRQEAENAAALVINKHDSQRRRHLAAPQQRQPVDVMQE
jgi:hypothetical protein